MKLYTFYLFKITTQELGAISVPDSKKGDQKLLQNLNPEQRYQLVIEFIKFE